MSPELQRAIYHVGAINVGSERYAFEHRIWCGDAHGEEAYFYLVDAPALTDPRALCEPSGLPFDTWLTDHCVRVKASWWRPSQQTMLRGKVGHDLLADDNPNAPLPEPFATLYRRVAVNYETGAEIPA